MIADEAGGDAVPPNLPITATAVATTKIPETLVTGVDQGSKSGQHKEERHQQRQCNHLQPIQDRLARLSGITAPVIKAPRM